MLMRQIETYLAKQRVKTADAKNIKFHMVTDLSCELTKVHKPWPAKLLDTPDLTTVDDSIIAACFERVNGIYESLAITVDRDAVARGPDFVAGLLDDVKRRFPSLNRKRTRLNA